MAFEPIGTDHLTIATTTQQIDRQAEIIAEIRVLHREVDFDVYTACLHCRDENGDRVLWPCDTMRIVEAVPL